MLFLSELSVSGIASNWSKNNRAAETWRTWVFFKDGLTVEVDAGVDNRVDGRQEPVGGGALAVVGPEMQSPHEYTELDSPAQTRISLQ